MKVYDWWTRDIFEATSTRDVTRLSAISHHMGDIRQAWEQLHETQMKAVQPSDFQLGSRVV